MSAKHPTPTEIIAAAVPAPEGVDPSDWHDGILAARLRYHTDSWWPSATRGSRWLTNRKAYRAPLTPEEFGTAFSKPGELRELAVKFGRIRAFEREMAVAIAEAKKTGTSSFVQAP